VSCLLAVPPIGVIVFPDTGIQANLADKARTLGIPVWRRRISAVSDEPHRPMRLVTIFAGGQGTPSIFQSRNSSSFSKEVSISMTLPLGRRRAEPTAFSAGRSR
jgi:hypothetical protein